MRLRRWMATTPSTARAPRPTAPPMEASCIWGSSAGAGGASSMCSAGARVDGEQVLRDEDEAMAPPDAEEEEAETAELMEAGIWGALAGGVELVGWSPVELAVLSRRRGGMSVTEAEWLLTEVGRRRMKEVVVAVKVKPAGLSCFGFLEWLRMLQPVFLPDF